MRINTVIPVEEALEVDSIAYFEVLYSLVNICIGTAEIGFNEELKFLIAESHIEVEVVAFSARAVPLVEVSNFVAVSILGSLDSQTLEGNLFILVLDEIICAEKRRCIKNGSCVLNARVNGEGLYIDYLDFA